VNEVSVRDDNEPMSTGSGTIDAKLLFPFENRFALNVPGRPIR